MPYTRREVRFLESSGSPLTATQKDKMNRELHDDPSLGHQTKGSAAMKQTGPHSIREMRIEIHRGPKNQITGHTVHHHMVPQASSKSAAFLEDTHHSYPFDGQGESDQHGNMMDHIATHLKVNAPGETGQGSEAPGTDEEEEEDEEKVSPGIHAKVARMERNR